MKRYLLTAFLSLLVIGLAAPVSALQEVTIEDATSGVTVTDMGQDGVRLDLGTEQ